MKTKVLALDVGRRRIGVAISDENRLFAFGRPTILNESGVFEHLVKLISEENIGQVVIGLPVTETGGETPQSNWVLRFEKKLRREVEKSCTTSPVNFSFQDEGYSSKEAEVRLERGQPATETFRRSVDQQSAVIILEDYLRLAATPKTE